MFNCVLEVATGKPLEWKSFQKCFLMRRHFATKLFIASHYSYLKKVQILLYELPYLNLPKFDIVPNDVVTTSKEQGRGVGLSLT